MANIKKNKKIKEDIIDVENIKDSREASDGTEDTATGENNENKKVSVKAKIPFAIVESYKNLRTSIAFLLSEAGGNSFAVTSANAGEGKSTTSSNLAIAFSQLGKKVLIIDCDLRRASLHKKFKIPNDKGLADIITYDYNFENTVTVINPVLHVLTAGNLPNNPSELLDSEKFAELMVYFNSIYDIVILDTPPLNVVSDSLIVAPLTAGVILVVRDGYTPHYSIKKAIEVMRFSNINILGSIMNGTNPKGKTRYVYRKNTYDAESKYYRTRYGYGRNGGGYGYGGYGYGYGSNRGNYGYGGHGSYGYGGRGSYGYGYGYGGRSGYGSYSDYSSDNGYEQNPYDTNQSNGSNGEE